jgi:hypothetical protein
MSMSFHRRAALTIALCFMMAGVAPAQDVQSEEVEIGEIPEDLDEVSRQLDNPLTGLWSLTLENKAFLREGKAAKDREFGNTLSFQPGLPIPLGANNEYVLISRPVFTLVTNPVIDPTQKDGVDGRTTGFGDLQLLTLAGPNKTDGLVWGVGSTMKFPTASDDDVGADKYQIGPALMLFSLRRPWIVGALVQNWFSVAGKGNAKSTARTDLQYVIRYALPNAWSIGMGPTLSIDWKAGNDDKVTLPVGLGLTKTIRIGSMPVKLRAEAHYSVIRPDTFGNEWTFIFRIAPVIPSPFAK